MKTYIISDITENAPSIIPYGLNMGKHTQTRVNIIHLIDPLDKQGTTSPVSDSHTVSPGEKLTHQEILEKEQTRARTLLDRLLSKEASRLNFPLRVDQTIEVRTVSEGFREILQAEPDSLVVTGTHPASAMADTLGELLKLIGPMSKLIMIIPPEHRFVPPKEVLLITDFSDNKETLPALHPWLSPFALRIRAMTITSSDKDQAEARGQQWQKNNEKEGESSMIFQTGVLQGDDPVKTLIDHVQQSNPDLVILPKSNQSAFAGYLYAGKHAGQFVETLGKPVLLY